MAGLVKKISNRKFKRKYAVTSENGGRNYIITEEQGKKC